MKITKNMISALLLLLSIAFTTTSIQAQTLNETVIKQWLNSQKALESWGDKHAATLDQYETDLPANPMDLSAETMLTPLRKSGLYKEANNLVKEYGFDSIDAWADITLRITKAAAAIEFAQNPELTDMSEMKELLNSAQIDPAQKKMIEQAMSQNKLMVEQIMKGTSKEDMKAVKPMINEIIQSMEDPIASDM